MVPLSFRLPSAFVERIDDVAARHGWSRSQASSAVLERGLECFKARPDDCLPLLAEMPRRGSRDAQLSWPVDETLKGSIVDVAESRQWRISNCANFLIFVGLASYEGRFDAKKPQRGRKANATVSAA